MKILFVTTANLSTNPRMLKEIRCLSGHYECLVLGFKLGNWSDELDLKLQKTLSNIQYHYLSAGREPFSPWLKSSFLNLICRKGFVLLSGIAIINAYGSDKRSYLLWKFLKRTKEHFDLVIAHNLGALYPAWKFCRHHNIPFTFDIEDYHPGEKYSGDSAHEKKRREWLMGNLLPDAALVTYASPLIGEQSLRLIGEEKIKKHFLINNSFNKSEFKQRDEVLLACGLQLPAKLRFIWFSQNVDRGRGLEEILPILDEFSDKIELHLIGNVRASFSLEYLKNRSYVVLHGTMSQSKLNSLLSSFDVGLALESKNQDFNRDICLTNKIWAYFQAGLYILATDTKAQRQFLSFKSWAGEILASDEEKIRERISWLAVNLGVIRHGSEERYKKAFDFCWEDEGKILLAEIHNIRKRK